MTDMELKVAIYLVFNENQGLTPIYKQKPFEICIKLRITKEEYEECKVKFQEWGLFGFMADWVLVTNDFAYVNYSGRDQLLNAKKVESEKIPLEVWQLYKTLTRPCQPLANPLVISNSKQEQGTSKKEPVIIPRRIQDIDKKYGLHEKAVEMYKHKTTASDIDKLMVDPDEVDF